MNLKYFPTFYDARETAAGHHKVHDKSELGTRSHFRLETFPRNFKTRLGFLDVKKVTLADAGNYTCRVDFMTSQTMMSLLQLTVHEEIQDLEVFDAYGTMIGKVVGPYKLLSRVMLSCRAYGGFEVVGLEVSNGLLDLVTEEVVGVVAVVIGVPVELVAIEVVLAVAVKVVIWQIHF
nr:uncharacterized protein LOC113812641 [Penaeus vannamei]